MFCSLFKWRTNCMLITHLKRELFSSSRLKAKALTFSVLMASCQRNTHFCGCKGTTIICNTQTIKPFQCVFYDSLTIHRPFSRLIFTMRRRILKRIAIIP